MDSHIRVTLEKVKSLSHYPHSSIAIDVGDAGRTCYNNYMSALAYLYIHNNKTTTLTRYVRPGP